MKNLQEVKRVKLNDNLNNEVRKIVDVFFEKTKRKINKKILIGFLVIRMDDGSYGSVRIYIDPFLKAKYGFDVYGEMDTIKFDKNKLWISLDPILNIDRTQVYNTLYHEFLHVTDPVLSSKATEKYYKTYDEKSDEIDELYYDKTKNKYVCNICLSEYTSKQNMKHHLMNEKKCLKIKFS